jgi:hypothetical protein
MHGKSGHRSPEGSSGNWVQRTDVDQPRKLARLAKASMGSDDRLQDAATVIAQFFYSIQ